MFDEREPTLDTLIEIAISDLGNLGDITSNFFIDNIAVSKGTIIAKERCIISGPEIAETVFKRIDPSIKVNANLESGSIADQGDVIINLSVIPVQYFQLKESL